MKISPINYISEIETKNYKIHLAGLFEGICQGGPVVGDLLINNAQLFPNSKFGGPFIEKCDVLFIPELVQSIFKGYGFKLVAINLASSKKHFITPWEPMVLLSAIKDDRINYYTDTENVISKTYKYSQNT